MKKAIQLTLSGILTATLISCGSKNNGGGDNPAPAPGITSGANEIHLQMDESRISWTSARQDIYIGNGEEQCVYGLTRGADDTRVSEHMLQIELLLNSGTISTGTRESASSQSRYITIEYSSGESRTYNLDPDLASNEEEYLSNGEDILTYYNVISNELDEYGHNNCLNGKGDK